MNRTALGIALVTVAVLALIGAGLVAYYNHEADLDKRCSAAGGRRVDIGVHQKLCFTEDWRWVKI